MSSCIHLQCVVLQFSLELLCKQLTEHQRMGNVSADANPSFVFEIFDIANLTIIGSKTRYRSLKGLKMPNNFVIHNAVSYHLNHIFTLAQRRVRAASHQENLQILLRFFCFGTCSNKSMRSLII